MMKKENMLGRKIVFKKAGKVQTKDRGISAEP